ncbi:universal stress protein [Rhodococcus sp. NPDC003383]
METSSLRHILVATDLSDGATHAVRRAAQLAREHHAQLTAVYVPASAAPEKLRRANALLAEHLYRCVGDTALNDTAVGDTQVDGVVRAGDIVSVVGAVAGECDADLLVVGAHGGRLPIALLGSTAERLVGTSATPVLVVRNPSDGPYRTVLLAVDTTPASTAAARVAAAWTPDADHILVHVSVVMGEQLMRMHGADDVGLAQLRHVSTEQARSHLDDFASTLIPEPADSRIESGHAATRIPEIADEYRAELIVVGTGARSALEYAMLGSVAQHVLRFAGTDVLVMPDGGSSSKSAV